MAYATPRKTTPQEAQISLEQKLVQDLKSKNYDALASYFKTDAGAAAFRAVIKDKGNVALLVDMAKDKDKTTAAVFKILDDGGSRSRLMKLLGTDEAITAVVEASNEKESLRSMLSVFEDFRGAKFVQDFLKTPSGWATTLLILEGMGNSGMNYYAGLKEGKETVKRTDHIYKNIQVKVLINLLNDGKTGLEVFKEFSQSDENVKECNVFLLNREGRKAMFDFVIAHPKEVAAAFREIFTERERIPRIAEIFGSWGGTNLMVELARSKVGRHVMLNDLAVEDGTKAIGMFMIGSGLGRVSSMRIQDGIMLIKQTKAAYDIFQALCSP
jgi:hypothetical protein